jgi:predicted MFS family arabinose efflux permease
MQPNGALMPMCFTFILAFFINTSKFTGRLIITLYALQLGAQPFTVGALAATSELLPTMLSWHAGRFSDRFGARWLLLTGAAAGIVGMLASYAKPGLPALFVTSVMYGLLHALYGAPLQHIVGLQSAPQDRAKNFSNFTLITSSAIFVSPLLAGSLIDHAGPDRACLGMVLLLLVPVTMLVVWGGILPSGTGTEKPRGSVRTLLSESGLWRVLATSSLVVTGIELFQVYMPIYGHGIGLSASAIGIILAICSLTSFVIRIFLPSLIKRLTVERLLAYSFLTGATAFLLVPFFKGPVILSLVSLLYGLGIGCANPITMMMTFSTSAPGRSGEAMGLRITANNLTRMICQVLFGSIGSAFGISPVFWVSALLFAAGGAVSHPPSTSRPQA